MKKYLTKISGTLICTGMGDSHISDKYTKIVNQPFEMILDNEEANSSTISILPNNLLMFYTCIGDEQPCSALYILKDWKTELIEEEIPVQKDIFNTLHNIFFDYKKKEDSIPQKVKDLIGL